MLLLFAGLLLLLPWRAEAPEGGITIRQNGLTWKIQPLTGSMLPEELYSYRGYRSTNGWVQEGASVLFFFQGEEGLYLGMIHGPTRGPGSAAFSFWGLPEGAYLAVKDDPDDAYWLDPPSAKFHWRWASGYTDGAILGGLGGEFTLSIYPQFGSEIKEWLLMTGDPQKPRFLKLPSLTAPLWVQVRQPDPLARFTFSPAEPFVGEEVLFDASSSWSSSKILRYEWDFDGDGTVEISTSSPRITHAFSEPGEVYVTLYIRDALGRTSTITKALVIRAGGVQVLRRIKTFLPAHQTLAGYYFIVELIVEAQKDIYGLGIQEEPPLDWTMRPLADDEVSVQFIPERGEWLFLEPLPAGSRTVLRYRVDLPKGIEPGAYPFTGWAVACCPETRFPLQGDREVQVISELPIEVAVSRLNERGEIDLTLSNLVTFEQILQAVALWKEGRPVPGTNGKRIDLETMVRLVAYWLTDTPVNQPLSSSAR